MTKPSFAGEVQFRRYTDSSTQGPGVYFGLADRDALQSFIGNEGKRYMVVLVEIGPDEMPVEPRKDTRGPLCKEACDLCELPEFQQWIAPENMVPSEALAKKRLIGICQVQSRKELDTSAEAGKRFIHGIRLPFMRRAKSSDAAALQPRN